MHKIRIKSRHATHNALRELFKLLRTTLPFLIRFGSVTEANYSHVPINTIEAIKLTANKLQMKTIFKTNRIQSPDFGTIDEFETLIQTHDFTNNIVIKRLYHSRGRDMALITTKEEAERWLNDNRFNKYYFYFEYEFPCDREYRIHCSKYYDETMAVRKRVYADRRDSFGRNLGNSYFAIDFPKPPCWDKIVEMSKKSVDSLGLDFGCVDVLYKNGGGEESIMICEVNSAPALGEKTTEFYFEMLKEIINKKEQ